MSFSGQDMIASILQIIGVDVLLGGDNAVVIALACRSLPPSQQKKAIIFGTGGAILIRSLLTMFAVYLLGLPYLKIVGGLLLLWIGVKLLLPDQESGGEVEGSGNLIAAIRTIIIADLVMSLDNVLAVAAAAKDHMGLVIFGLLFSIPLIVYGSRLIIRLMDRFPIIITLGGGLLGYVAGEMFFKDVAIQAWVEASAAYLHYLAPWTAAVLVVLVGKWLGARANRRAQWKVSEDSAP